MSYHFSLELSHSYAIWQICPGELESLSLSIYETDLEAAGRDTVRMA